MIKIKDKIILKIKYFFKKILFSLIDLELFFHKGLEHTSRKLFLIRIDAIGDFILFSPMLKYYRKLYSSHLITLLVNKINQELAERFDNFDKIIFFDRKKFDHNIFYRRELLLKIKKANFDIAIYPAYSRESKGDYLIKISGAKQRIGLDGDLSSIAPKQKEKNNKYYTKLIKLPSNVISEIEKNKKIVELLGGLVNNNYVPFFRPSISDQERANQFLLKHNISKDDKFAIICPGAGDVRRIWPLNKFSRLINWLGREKKFKVIICGSPEEKNLADKIKQYTDLPIIDIVGQTDLLSLAAILEKAVLYVGNDNGVTHLAVAIGTPTVCLVGGGHPARFFPWGDLTKNKIVYYKMPCFGCDWHCKYDSAKCVQNISVKQVISKINKLI